MIYQTSLFNYFFKDYFRTNSLADFLPLKLLELFFETEWLNILFLSFHLKNRL